MNHEQFNLLLESIKLIPVFVLVPLASGLTLNRDVDNMIFSVILVCIYSSIINNLMNDLEITSNILFTYNNLFLACITIFTCLYPLIYFRARWHQSIHFWFIKVFLRVYLVLIGYSFIVLVLDKSESH